MSVAPASTDGEVYRLAFPELVNPPPTYISSGISFADSCVKHVTQTSNKSRAYIIASASLSKQTPHLQHLEKALGKNHAATWIGIRQHTFWDDLVPIINDTRDKNADVLISLGGGSIADAIKIIGYALANDVRTVEDMRHLVKRTPEDLERKDGLVDRNSVGNPVGNPPEIPSIFIPTTLSGAEYSKYSGGTNSETHQKDQVVHNGMYAKLVILDPQLTLPVPVETWIQSGVRAIDHCCEAICSIQGKLEINETASKRLKRLIPGLLSTKAYPEDLDGRLQTILGACLAMAALAADVHKGASHGIGHQLGPLGVGHGHTSCILLPAVMKWNADHAAIARIDILARQRLIERTLWAIPEATRLFEQVRFKEGETKVGDLLRRIIRELGMPSTLKEVGVGREKLGALATNCVLEPYCIANPVKTDKEKILEILELVVE